MQEYYNDNQIKFEYDPQINKFAFKKNHVGVTAGDEIALADYTYTDSNTIFVSNLTGDDTTGTGTQATPYKTILKGINECTATKTKVVVLDYHIFAEDISGYSNAYFAGIYSALTADREYTQYHTTSRIATSADGQHITVIPLASNKAVIAWADADDGNQGKFIITSGVNTIYKSLTEFGATAAVNLQGVVLANDNFVLAYDGQFVIYDATGTLVKAETAVNAAGSTEYCSIAAYSSGGFIITYRDTGDSNYGNYVIYDNSGAVVVSESRFRTAQTEYIQSTGLANNTVAIAFRDEDDSDKGKFLTIDYTGTASAETTFNNASTTLYYGAMSLLSNDNFLITYKDDTSGDCYATAYDEDGNSEVSAFQVDANACTYIASAAITGYFAILYNDGTDSDNNLVIYENDGTSYLTKTQIESNACIYNNISALTNGDLIYAYNDSGDTAMLRWNVHTINELPRHSHRILGYTPTDSNSIFVSSEDILTGDDTWAGTQKEPNLTIDGAVANVDGTHQAVVILDSETYDEVSQEFTGNFLGLYAAIGQEPIINFDILNGESFCDYTNPTTEKADAQFTSGDVQDMDSDILSNGNIVHVWIDETGDIAYFRIINNSGEEIIAATSVKTSISGSNYVCVCSLINGGFAIGYSLANSVYFQIYDNSGNQDVSETIVSSSTAYNPEMTSLANNEFVICWKEGGGTNEIKYEIFDDSGSSQHSGTLVSGCDIAYHYGLATLTNGDWICVYTKSIADQTPRFIIRDSDGGAVVAETAFGDTGSESCDVASLPTGKFVAVWNRTIGDDAIRYDVRDNDGTNSIGLTTLYTVAATLRTPAVIEFDTGAFCCIWHYTSSNTMYAIANENGTTRISGTVLKSFGASSNEYPTISKFDNGNIFFAYSDASTGYLQIKNLLSFSGYKIFAASTLNGLNIDGGNDYLLTKLLEVNSAKPTIKWCNFLNCTNPSTDENLGYAVYGDNETDLYNSIIADNDAGMYLGAAVNDAIIQDNQFYRNNAGYAIHIDGTAAGSGDITIEHNDIFDNYAGIRLENNNGTNEILKNNIIHNNDNDGINADNGQAYSYTIITDSTTNGSAGSSVILANPLYINEGAITPSAIDLNIKTQIEGYQTDSPAKDLADDSRNAGSLDVSYIGSLTTWTAITVSKPLQGSIDVEYEGSGVVKNQRRDGSIASNKISQTEKLTITWDGILNTEFAYIRAMWICTSSRVRIYMDPTTSPLIYDEYNLEYAKLKASPGNYILSETGVRGVKLIFGKSYTE